MVCVADVIKVCKKFWGHCFNSQNIFENLQCSEKSGDDDVGDENDEHQTKFKSLPNFIKSNSKLLTN